MSHKASPALRELSATELKRDLGRCGIDVVLGTRTPKVHRCRRPASCRPKAPFACGGQHAAGDRARHEPRIAALEAGDDEPELHAALAAHLRRRRCAPTRRRIPRAARGARVDSRVGARRRSRAASRRRGCGEAAPHCTSPRSASPRRTASRAEAARACGGAARSSASVRSARSPRCSFISLSP